MARPRNFDEDQVTQIVMNLFWEKGYQGTSMQDLVDATRLQKGSLYGAFGNKQALYLAALEHYERLHIQAGINMLRGEESPVQKVNNLFESVIQSTAAGVFAGGCLLCNASMEMAPIDSAVQKSVQKTITRLKNAVKYAIQSHNLTDGEQLSMANSIVGSYFGTRIYARAGVDIQAIRDARDLCLEMLELKLAD